MAPLFAIEMRMRFRRRILRPGETSSASEMVASGPSIAVQIDPEGFEGLTLQRDPSPASWVADSVWRDELFGTVSAIIPPGFEAFTRVGYTPDGPRENLDVHHAMFDVLAGHTGTPDDVWFCLWEGYGGLDLIPANVTLLRSPPGRATRRYLLYRGALSAWGAMSASPFWKVPDLVWPEDRAWFLGSDTDFDCGFVGATNSCVDALTDGVADTVRVQGDDRLIDLVNLER